MTTALDGGFLRTNKTTNEGSVFLSELTKIY